MSQPSKAALQIARPPIQEGSFWQDEDCQFIVYVRGMEKDVVHTTVVASEDERWYGVGAARGFSDTLFAKFTPMEEYVCLSVEELQAEREVARRLAHAVKAILGDDMPAAGEPGHVDFRQAVEMARAALVDYEALHLHTEPETPK